MAFQLSEENRVIFGVCGGLAKDLNIDPFVIRLLFVLLAVCAGGGVALYIILWLLMALNS